MGSDEATCGVPARAFPSVSTCVSARSTPPRYEQARNLSRDLEAQAARVHEEAKRAGDKAVEIYASVAQLSPVDSEALEVRGLWGACVGWCW